MHFWKFWNCSSKRRAIWKLSKIMRVIYPKNCRNQKCDYWLITPNQAYTLRKNETETIPTKIMHCLYQTLYLIKLGIFWLFKLQEQLRKVFWQHKVHQYTPRFQTSSQKSSQVKILSPMFLGYLESLFANTWTPQSIALLSYS